MNGLQANQIKKILPICPECHKTFSTKGNLKNHINVIHQGIKLFNCTFQGCNSKFSNKSRLEVHIRTHFGQKPFQCPICNKSFNEKGNLKTHMKFHSPDRPFQCNLCSKNYKTKGHLKDHIQVKHIQKDKYICKFCLKDFRRFPPLLYHLKSKHQFFEKISSADAKVTISNSENNTDTNSSDNNYGIFPTNYYNCNIEPNQPYYNYNNNYYNVDNNGLLNLNMPMLSYYDNPLLYNNMQSFLMNIPKQVKIQVIQKD